MSRAGNIVRKAFLGTAACMVSLAIPAQVTLAQDSETVEPVASQVPREHARNIIFVLVDDLRFDGMGFLQPGLLKTPNIGLC